MNVPIGKCVPRQGFQAADVFVGTSAWAREIRRQILEIAPSLLGVLISGPNGTGKELIARAIHRLSGRANKPFIPVDCASAVGEIFASHLFGQIQGAFTGARTTLGCFRAAEGGTLFLDEIGELTPAMQSQLLRVLEEKSLVPVGAVTAIPIHVRVIAATNRNLLDETRAGRFRRDLYHRLNMIELQTIALRDHPEDIEILSRHFIAACCRDNGLPNVVIDASAAQELRGYDWPGNVRELKNVIERVLLGNQGQFLTAKSLLLLQSLTTRGSDPPSVGDLKSGHHTAQHAEPPRVVADASSAAGITSVGEPWLGLDELERYHVQQTLIYTLNNQTAAAKLLGITRRVLDTLIKKHGLEHDRPRRGHTAKTEVVPSSQFMS